MSWTGVRVVGAVALVGAIVGWAWTLTGLTPHMRRMSGLAPMPGGDGEVFLWVAELRWGAVLLAALGLVAVAVTGPRAPVAGVALAGALIVADTVLAAGGPAGKLVPALAVGLVAAVAALLAAGPAGTGADVRGRLAVVGVTGTACGPLLFAQGTPAVNHFALPDMMGAIHASVIGLLVALGATAAAAVRRPRAAVLAAVVAVPFAAWALTATRGADPETTVHGVATAPVLAVLAYAVARPGATRPRAVALGALGAAAVGVLALPALIMALSVWSMIPATLLFEAAGRFYPADGVSVLPGVALAVPLVVVALVKRVPAPAREAVSR